MAFKFSLATVLRVRVIREEREERMLQQIVQKIHQMKRAASEMDEAMGRLAAARFSEILQTVSGRDLHGSYGEVQRLREERRQLEEQIAQIELLKEKQFAVYAAARREREMLTDMCERKRRVFEAEQMRREQKTVDDNTMARRNRL